MQIKGTQEKFGYSNTSTTKKSWGKEKNKSRDKADKRNSMSRIEDEIAPQEIPVKKLKIKHDSVISIKLL